LGGYDLARAGKDEALSLLSQSKLLQILIILLNYEGVLPIFTLDEQPQLETMEEIASRKYEESFREKMIAKQQMILNSWEKIVQC
jgi:hypothetical protein